MNKEPIETGLTIKASSKVGHTFKLSQLLLPGSRIHGTNRPGKHYKLFKYNRKVAPNILGYSYAFKPL